DQDFLQMHSIDIAPNFEGRAQMTVDLGSKQSTLQLDKVLMQDSRNFECSVTIQGDDEGKTAATTTLLVLVAPSRPVCGIQGTAEYWNNISLSCMSEEGSPSPTYKWKSYSVLNAPRPYPLRATEKDGVLALFNISKEDSGFFVCTTTNRVGHDSCNLTLSVLPIGATAGIIGGVVAGLVVLAIVIYCCCCKKDKENKPVEGYSDRFEEKSVRDLGNHNDNRAGTSVLEAEQHSYNDAENGYGNGSDGIRGRLDEKRDFSRGSRDRLDDQDEIRGSRDRLDDRNEIRGSRDRLDDQDEIRGSRDRLDDHPNRYRGSSDRLDDQHDRYRGSRDRLDDQHDDIRGSRDRLDDKRDRYRGSRDRLDDQSDEVRGSRDNLDNTRDRYGSRDRLDDNRDRRHGSRDNLDAQYNRHGGSRDRLGESRPSYNV
uniref:Ig-like domain-containing protein n=1 Tax=Gadus morhua TaxID=8049 RepID=A0A8C4ZEN6_GADMO